MGKYKKLYGTLLLGLIAIIILLTAVFSYSRSIEESYKEENINSLKELSNQGALMLHNGNQTQQKRAIKFFIFAHRCLPPISESFFVRLF